MINRTLIRVKAFKELYSRIITGSSDIKAAERELMDSFVQTRRLFAMCALLPSALATLAEDRISTQYRKFNPDKDVIEKNTRFSGNAFSKLVRSDSVFAAWCRNEGISWNEYETPLKSIYNSILKKEYFQDYTSLENPGMKEAVGLFRNIFSEELSGNEVLEDALETNNIWWTEDLEYVINCLNERLWKMASKGAVEIPPVFENKDDEEFARKLVSTVLVNYDDILETVTSYITNWEAGREVQSDLLIIVMGVAEAQTFSTIPPKVTINEYVELSKHFSTPKSFSFVNGLLYTIIKDMMSDGRIQKDPRGMIGGGLD